MSDEAAGAAESRPETIRLPGRPAVLAGAPRPVLGRPPAPEVSLLAASDVDELDLPAGGETMSLPGARAALADTLGRRGTPGGSPVPGTAPAVATVATVKPGGGTVYGGAGAVRVPPGSGPPPAIDALRLDYHRAPLSALDRIVAPQASTGLLLGADPTGAPVVLRMFRPEVTRLALVAGLWHARLLVFRSLALGARVVVFTRRPAAWQGLGSAATGRDDRVAVLSGERPVVLSAGPATPALHVYDVGPSGATRPPTLGQWHTQLTLLPGLSAYGFGALDAAHLTLVRRLTAEEAGVAGPVLGLPAPAVGRLTDLHDDMLAVLAPDATRYTYLLPTSIERTLFGPADPSAGETPTRPVLGPAPG